MQPAADPTLAPPEAPDAPPRWAFVVRWLRRTAIVFGLVFVTAIGAVLALLWPYLRDDLVLDRIVLAVALDWRDFGRDKAQARLEYELDHQGIGLQVSDEHCAFEESEAALRTVACSWTAAVELPLLDRSVPLSFRSVAEVGPDGSIR